MRTEQVLGKLDSAYACSKAEEAAQLARARVSKKVDRRSYTPYLPVRHLELFYLISYRNGSEYFAESE